jgi:hypothetical protein
MKQIVSLTAMVCLLALAAYPNDTVCGALPPAAGSLTGAHDNVIVPAGMSCIILSAQIKGSVKVFGALLVVDTMIQGNVDGEPGHLRVILSNGTMVRGSVQLKGGYDVSGDNSSIVNAQINGNFQFEENRVFLFAANSIIGGNFKMEKNTGGGQIGVLFGNLIGGNLECKENAPAPAGVVNAVRGAKKDQCATF